MNVLVIGGGGREHAIIDALSKSKKVSKIYAAPGNAGIAQLAECMPIKDTDVDNLVTFGYNHNIALTVVGPEVALAAGVVNAFEAHGLKIFGPTKEAAQIALKANVKQLVLGHYSTRYDGIERFKQEAESVFPNVLLGDDGLSFEF